MIFEVRNADRILFLDKGKLIEEGNHNQLMDLHGRYYEFVMSSELIDTEKLDNENKFISE